MWEVRDDHGVRPTAGLVEENEVGDILGETGLDEGSDDGVTAIQAI